MCQSSLGSSTPSSLRDVTCCGVAQTDLTLEAVIGEGLGILILSHLSRCVYLTPLRALEAVPEEFLAGCSGLKEVDLSPLVLVEKVDRCFLFERAGLTSIILAPLRDIEVVPAHFLAGMLMKA